MKIVTLTLCAAFDIHAESEKIIPGRENLAKITDHNAGGKGVNISRALNRFGADNVAVVVVGDENGDDFVKRLENENICLQIVHIPGRIRENITIHTSNGEETRISFAGDFVPEDLLLKIAAVTDEICDKDTVVTFTGRLPAGVSVFSAKKYIKKLQERGIRVVIDSKSFTLDDIIELKPFLIKPNEEEIEEYLGRDISDFDSAAKAARELSLSGIENVMISLGEKGAVLCSNSELYYAAAPKINAVSTIGAGDSSIAGFLYATSKGADSAERLKTAVAFGSAACLTPGTNPPDPAEVERLLEITAIESLN